MHTVAALFVDRRGPYWNRPDIDAWDIERDARKYAGDLPVVAHPPCQLWVNLAAVNWKRYRRELPAWYPGGGDDGCFASALAAVRKFGGVLEHPAYSHAWDKYNLDRPEFGRWIPYPANDWVTEVWQSAYGHPARKRTWLYYHSPPGRHPADLIWAKRSGTHQVGWFDRIKPTLGKREANKTPSAFADLLIRLAKAAR